MGFQAETQNLQHILICTKRGKELQEEYREDYCIIIFFKLSGQILRSMGSRIKIQLVIPIAFSPGGPHLFCVHRLNCFRSSFAVKTDICVAKYTVCDIQAMSYFVSSMIVNTADRFSRYPVIFW